MHQHCVCDIPVPLPPDDLGYCLQMDLFFLPCEFRIMIAVSRTVEDNEREETSPEYTAGV